MAIWHRSKIKDVIVHTDQESTYASGECRLDSSANKLRCSMCRKGECLDSAVVQRFFGSLKNELLYHEYYRARAGVRQSIFEYIEVFYNRQPRHAFSSYLTPAQYEANHVCN